MRIITPVLLLLLGSSLVFAESQNSPKAKKNANDQSQVSHSSSEKSEGQKQHQDLSTSHSKNQFERSKLTLSAMKRARTIKNDIERVKKYHEAGIERGSLSSNVLDELSTPSIETEGYFGYPSTLDYIIDVYVESTDGTISPYTAIIDTGSSNLAISVSDCEDCGSGSSDLDVDYYSPEMCVDVTYGSGSWSGLMTASTYVAMGDDELLGTDIYFSAITSGSSFFTSEGFQGILGLGYTGICSNYEECSSSLSFAKASSNIPATPYTDSLLSAGVISDNIFTLNFCQDELSMAIGGVDSAYYTGDITYVDTQKTYGETYGYFLIYIDAITFDGSSISASNMNKIGGTLVDSGTTLLYLPNAVHSSIKTTLEDSYGLTSSLFQWESCLSEDDLSDLPTLILTSGSYDLTLEPEDYFLDYEDCYYWGISTSSIPIIGNIALQDLMVVFDKENHQVGFADAVCDDELSSDDDSSDSSDSTDDSSDSSDSSDSTDDEDIWMKQKSTKSSSQNTQKSSVLQLNSLPTSTSSVNEDTKQQNPIQSSTTSSTNEDIKEQKPIKSTTTSSTNEDVKEQKPIKSTTTSNPSSTTTLKNPSSTTTPSKPLSKSQLDIVVPAPVSSSKSVIYSIVGFTLFVAVFAFVTYYRYKSRLQYDSIPSVELEI